MEARLDPLFQAATKDGQLPGIAAIILDSSGKTLYRKSSGVNNLSAENSQQYTTSTPTLIWSCTKLVTCIAALQLIEQGKLSLSDPVDKYVPEIKKLKVLDPTTKDANGNYSLRDAKSTPTVVQLFTHTAGFTYDFFNADLLAWQIQNQRTPAAYLTEGTWDAYQTPLGSDPGEQYCYGINIDWLGFVVEAITSKPLNVYIEENITSPLNMKNTTANFPSDSERLVVHLKNDEGTPIANPDLLPAASPDRYGGGHYLVSTLDDYSTLLLTILNGGTHPLSHTKILENQTVSSYLFKDFVPTATSNSSSAHPAADIGLIASSVPQLSATGRFLPDTKLGWSCGLMLNLDDVPHGRRAMSGAWAGLGNLYYWIDPVGERTGMIMTSVLPFFDRTVLELFGEMEGAAYGSEEGSVKGFSAP